MCNKLTVFKYPCTNGKPASRLPYCKSSKKNGDTPNLRDANSKILRNFAASMAARPRTLALCGLPAGVFNPGSDPADATFTHYYI